MGRQNIGDRVAVVGGVRTPFSKQLTDLATLDPIEMGKKVVVELIQRVDLPVEEIEQLVFGAVLAVPAAPNIAREIAIGARLPDALDAYSVSRACATSLQAASNVAQAIQTGQIECGIAGGADSSSILPIGVSRALADALVKSTKARSIGAKLKCFKNIRPRHIAPVPPAVKDYTTGLGMGQAAEQMARDNGISRESQDEFAHRSHVLAQKAWEAGLLDSEVMAVHAPGADKPVIKDNVVRSDSTLEGYAKLRPAFDRQYGTVTAGNATPLSDGAAAVMLMSEQKAKALGLPILGYIKSMAFSAIDAYQNMLMGPSYATPKALDAAGLTLQDIDLIDMHEAFAAQALCNIQAFGSKKFAKEKLYRDKAIGEIDMDRFNIQGGSIAFGHPFAATGARLITQSLNQLNRQQKQFGLITACAAGGLGAAFVLEAK